MFPVDYLKTLPGLALGKTCLQLSSYTSHGGSTLPGRLAACLSPALLPKLAAQLKEGCLLITGTNGKTTTAHLLAQILSRAGKKIIHNCSGANLPSGVTTPFIAASSWSGKIEADLGVIEIDEAFLSAVAPQLRVKAVLVTNLFADQLDRFGELGNTLQLIIEGLHRVDKDAFLLLNADDPLVANIKKKVRTFYYGIDAISRVVPSKRKASISKICPRCGERYDYVQLHFAHLGIYRCRGCGEGRPPPHYSLVHFQKRSPYTEIIIKAPTGISSFPFKMTGFYNLYNALAAISCALALGIEAEVIKAGLSHYKACFGRMGALEMEGRTVRFALIKNPTGANEVLCTLATERRDTTVLLAINDQCADGQDLSWLWEVDFESWASPASKIKKIFCSGNGEAEIFLRLKYAGLKSKLRPGGEDIKKTFKESLRQTPVGGKLQLLFTYSAMLQLKETINKMGF